MERPRQVHVAEDEVRLGGLVRTADEHCLGVFAHQLDALELTHDRVHREREDTSSGESRGRCSWSRL